MRLAIEICATNIEKQQIEACNLIKTLSKEDQFYIFCINGSGLKFFLNSYKEHVVSIKLPSDIVSIEKGYAIKFFYLPYFLKFSIDTLYLSQDDTWIELKEMKKILFKMGVRKINYLKTNSSKTYDETNSVIFGFENHRYSKKTVAFVTPLPPQHSGIADYSAELLPFLANRFDIDVYSDCQECSSNELNKSFNILDWRELGNNIDIYDVIIYQMGNSSFHSYMYELILKYPGVVVLHDFYISHLIKYLSFVVKEDPAFFYNEFMYSHRSLKTYRDYIKNIDSLVMRYPINKRIIDAAYGIIVHSTFSKELFYKYYNNQALPLIGVIPQIHKEYERRTEKNKKIARHKIGISDDIFLIITLGLVTPNKYPDLLLRSFTQLKNTNFNIMLCFVGGLNSVISENDLNTNNDKMIKVTGFVEQEVYSDYIKAADIAVQLRSDSRGETSRAVLDCLAYGIPVIVNDYATFADYNDDVVYKVPKIPTEKDIIDAVLVLLNDENKRKEYSVNEQKLVHECHSGKYVTERYEDFICQIISKYDSINKRAFIKETAKMVVNYGLSREKIIKLVNLYENGIMRFPKEVYEKND